MSRPPAILRSPDHCDSSPTKTRPDLSIVIPAYNEENTIGSSLLSIAEYAQDHEYEIEVIVVDDGSTDSTASCVTGNDWNPLSVIMLQNRDNKGKGYSVRRGVLEASGGMILTCDADMSTPIAELTKLEAWICKGYSIVIGSRDMESSILDPPQPRMRRFLAHAFRGLRRRLLLHNLRDTQCGFKLFSKEAARRIFTLAEIDGWLADCEVLGIADRLGMQIKEVGVTWRNDPNSSVRPIREAPRTVTSLIALRKKLRTIKIKP